MANPEHLEILKLGVKAWNEWRRENVVIRPNLEGANLKGAHLSRTHLNHAYLGGALLRGADLIHTDLSWADLNAADLNAASLIGADLRGSNLRGADLRDASLIHADLRGSHLRGADFGGAHLGGADFSRAYLSGAEFTNVILAQTTFADNDFSEVEGLGTVRHAGPSYLSIDTIYKSRGIIPEVFLRGCGVPQSFILQIPKLVANSEPILYYSCFISYSSKDQDFADKLYSDLKSNGVRCWFAPEDLKIGDKFRDRIDQSIRQHDKLLIILSDNSIESPWVDDEVESARERERMEGRVILLPITIDDAVKKSEKSWAATIRRTRHIGDFKSWKGRDELDSYSKALDRLLRDLKAEKTTSDR